jgi:hydrophobic/amphiphilic exporter-1 (mainly G- bacteria), HAE1 family
LKRQAGGAGQRTIGTMVFGGMLASTLLAIPFVPVLYVITQRLSERFQKDKLSSKSGAEMSTLKNRNDKQ